MEVLEIEGFLILDIMNINIFQGSARGGFISAYAFGMIMLFNAGLASVEIIIESKL